MISCGKGSSYKITGNTTEMMSVSPSESMSETMLPPVDETLPIQEEDKNRLFCDLSNYEEFVKNHDKILELIEQTGKGCQLEGADFSEQNLLGYDFSYANLSSAIFKSSDLTNVDFTGAILKSADFQKKPDTSKPTVLNNTNFTKANAEGANFKEVNLDRAIFQSTILEQATYSPNYRLAPNWLHRIFSPENGIKDPENRGMIPE